MGWELNDQKRRTWQARFDRYRASGLTVSRFCKLEKVSSNTFYYWSKRIGQDAETGSASTEGRNVPQASRGPAMRQPASVTLVQSMPAIEKAPLVHFQLSESMRVSIPADCLDAIRCIVQCSQQAAVTLPDTLDRSDAFRPVLTR